LLCGARRVYWGRMIYRYGTEEIVIRESLPVLPVRDTIIFPYMVSPMIVGRQFSIEALQEAMVRDKQILLLAQKDKAVENPVNSDLYGFGTVARILQVMKLNNGTMKVLVEGLCRAKAKRLSKTEGYLGATLQLLADDLGDNPTRLEALARSALRRFGDYVALNRRIPDEVIANTQDVPGASQIADVIAAHLQLSLDKRQLVLEAVFVPKRLEMLAELLSAEIEILELEQKIDSTVRDSMTQNQREYYLQNQLKAIKTELGQADDEADVESYRTKIKESSLPAEVAKKATEEVDRLGKMHSYSAEANVIRTYIDWLLSLPWNVYSEDRTSFKEVEDILNAEHYGLEKAKARILEHLAVIKLAKNVKGPILCLVGPPGVGKTSLGKSVANSLNRKFARMSLGGMRDEAEIRGHRRTYIGALPGRIIQMLKKAKTANPVMLLDEVDKIGSDFHGDPASALLEVLDPEQNSTFQDHYLECEFDLSKIVFITTANTTAGIPMPLLDRMEMIELPGYLEFEKVKIAEEFLVPKQKMECGLVEYRIDLPASALQTIIRDYTREAGVRELERKIGTIFRQIAQKIARGDKKKRFVVTKPDLKKYLGARKYHELEMGAPSPGRAIGLAWTRAGGEILPVEVSLTDGSGKVMLTGKLGEVMQESARAALTYLKSNADRLKISKDKFKNLDVHLHLPEGAVPKDGPSAGITILVALTSAFLQKAPARDLSYTGEITLSGEVLPVGGLSAKLIAAVRAGIKTVIAPQANKSDIEDLPKELTSKLKIILVKRAADVLRLAFPK
jgi:ATP-dependent Lon protease